MAETLGKASFEKRAQHGRHLAQRSAELMHPRNPYQATPPDFAALARFDPEFAKHVRPGVRGASQIDWSSPEALVALTRTLLWQDFGLRWQLPEGRLCPTVPSRLNYLLWLQDVLAQGRPGPPGGGKGGLGAGRPRPRAKLADAGPPALCVDIGTGASAIYALLGSAALGWSFIATEIDPSAADSARCRSRPFRFFSFRLLVE